MSESMWHYCKANKKDTTNHEVFKIMNCKGILTSVLLMSGLTSVAQTLKLNDKGYYETRGVNVMVYSNPFSAAFYDEKRSGIDIIHHGVMTITNGGVRFNETPEQWNLVPEMRDRKVDKATGEVTVQLYYKEYDFEPRLKVRPQGEGFAIEVYLDKEVPAELQGKACFNLEFLPSAYWNHTYFVDGKPNYFPRYPVSDTETRPLDQKAKQVNDLITSDTRGTGRFVSPKPIAEGHRFVMAPDDPLQMVTISSETALQLYDGRILAQNGWLVVHSFLPASKTGKVLEWLVEPNSVKDWVREPVIGFSQVGYTPDQRKTAIIELDPNDKQLTTAEIYRVGTDGKPVLAKKATATNWGQYMRYNYLMADFSDVKEPGIYYIKYGDLKTNSFPIADDVYAKVWMPTIDVWFPVQMDHMAVKEGYRVWHNAPHLDDVVQAPVNIPHFDMFQMGSESFSPYKDYEHIDGFDAGGWFDAGDWDIEGNSHANVVTTFSTIWDLFRLQRDETMVDKEKKYVNIHFADGKPDLLQQIEHGVLPLVTIVEKIGHACRGINHATLYQYNRLDEPSTITDNKVGTGDERWLFTYYNSGMTTAFMTSLAAASRALKDFNPELSDRCLKAAVKLWNDNEGKLQPRELQTPGFQLFLTTGDKKYIEGLEQNILASFVGRNGRTQVYNIGFALQAAPYMSKDFLDKLRPYVEQYKQQLDRQMKTSPYGVTAYGTGWGNTGSVVSQGMNCYYANKYFPDIISKDEVYKCADFIFGCHPYHNRSFVMGVGVRPKNVSYGNNRADFSFIPGALVPGLILLQPDYMENKDDWPFFWGQNEATIAGNAQYLLFGLMLSNLK